MDNKTEHRRIFPTIAELRRKWATPSPFEGILDRALCDAREVLLFGAGRGFDERDLRAPGRLVTGVDVDSAVMANPHVDRAVVYDGVLLPFEAEAFDLCVTRWVIEHLTDPEPVMREIARVVRPGGRFLFITTNAWFYAAILARVIPDAIHRPIIKVATPGREISNTFNTYYRANTRRKLRRLLAGVGFKEEYLRVELDDAAYLQFSAITYAFGTYCHRLVNKVPAFEDLGHAIIGQFVRELTLM